MKVLHFDCFSGASGDMILAALVNAGAPLEDVRSGIETLGLRGWELEMTEVRRAGLRATQAIVRTVAEVSERRYADVMAILEGSKLPQRISDLAGRAFAILARAEASVHGISEQEVVFHEVGALDALIDVVGSCTALALLDPGRVTASAVASGTGLAETAHGTWPLPVPAVAEILRQHRVPLFARGEVELTTPTGAALLAAFVEDFAGMPPMRLRNIGYGAGARDLEVPNVLRVFVGDALDEHAREDAVLVECNLDDMSPELVPHLLDALLAAGAQDAWVTPTLGKKGRPAFVVSALTSPGESEQVTDVIFRETPTLGLRRTSVVKEALERRWVTVDVEGHDVRVKLGLRGGEIVTVAPEHDDAVTVARATGMALRAVYAAALQAAAPATPKKP